MTIKTNEELMQVLSEDTNVSPALAKRIIDNLTKRGIEPEAMTSVIWEIKEKICDDALLEKLNKSTDEEIGKAIDDMMDRRWDYSEKAVEVISEILLSDDFSEDKEYELITTAMQTDHRYGDFQYSKEDLETMAKNFNDNVVGTEIPVDFNHDPQHLAYAWIKPGSMTVKESSTLKGQCSLYGQIYRYTPEGKDMVTTGKVRYFSLQIQNVFSKFVDKQKKTYNLVIRALALTNMPVIKDMAPTFTEVLNSNHTQDMEKVEQLEKELSETKVTMSEKDKLLADKDAENIRLSEELKKVNAEKRDAFLSEEVDKLCLSEDKSVGFKGGEKAKVLAFVKTLSEEQATTYFALHTNLITSVDLGEHGDGTDSEASGDEGASKVADTKAKELAHKEGITYSAALTRVLSENKELAAEAF